MVEIFTSLEDVGLPKIEGERYERNIHQTLSLNDFEYLTKKLSDNFDVYVEDSPLFTPLPAISNLIKVVKIKGKKIFGTRYKYI